MLKFNILLTIFASTLIKGDDVFYHINNKQVLHKVSEKFLSISIDPAVLLAGVNLSDASLTLAKHLSPAYIRLAGPSTPFVKYLDNEEDVFSHKEKGDNVYITPSMWFGINEWFNLANLTPVFGLNDREREKGVWDPRSTMPLLELSDKFGVSCYWQLGFDCSNKSTVQYVEDLNILKQTLKDFPEHNETWKVVGSDLSTCNSEELSSNSFNNYLQDLDKTVDAVMWQTSLISRREIGLTKASLWTSILKDAQPVTFSSAMDWARTVGVAACLGYDVVFREPRLLEITHDTPVYWVSFLYKKLMGANVLEIRSMNQHSDLSAFSHCTRMQNNFVRSGAVTIMMVNNGSETSTANVRLGGILLDKSMEVQSYFLTPSNYSTSKVLLNGQDLTMEMLRKPNDLLKSRLRRAKIRTHISLEIPAQTIGFFVLTGARYALCTNTEDDLTSILEEISEDQELSLSSEEVQFNIEGRRGDNGSIEGRIPVGNKITLESIKQNILKEMELDKSLYNSTPTKVKHNKIPLGQEHREYDNYKRDMLHKHLRAFIEKSKKNDLQTGTKKEEPGPPSGNLHLTIKEIEDILKRRARAKAAAKNVRLTSTELDMLVDRATLKIPKRFISKRDINRILLEEKANFYKNNIFTQEMFEHQAKETKLFPKFKFRRSEPRLKRSGHLMKPLSNGFLRAKRDINLDLLKKRTESNSHFGRQQPNLKHRQSMFQSKGRTYEPESLDGPSLEELFDDLAQFEDKLLPRGTFAGLDSLDLDKIEEDFFKKPKSKHANVFENLFVSPRRRNKDSEEYLQLLKSSAEELGGDLDDVDEPCLEEFGFSVSGPKYGKEKKVTELWGVKSGRNVGKSRKEQSLCADLGDLNFTDDLDYGFLRKKRNVESMTKKKLRALKKDIRSEVRKLKHQLKDDKAKYLKQKIKLKAEQKKRSRKHRSNIQIVPKDPDVNSTINRIIENANSEENTIPPQLQGHIKKRSLVSNNIFGHYKPLTSGLKAWKPADILNLQKTFFTTLPVYSWVQDQNMRNAVIKKNFLHHSGLRKKRYIADNSINVDDNEISINQNHKAKWLHEKDFFDHFFTTTESHRETATNKVDVKQSDKPTAVIDKLITQRKLTYLERALGKKKVKPIEDFFRDVKGAFNNMTRAIKEFYDNIF